jgi:hypothetical protein
MRPAYPADPQRRTGKPFHRAKGSREDAAAIGGRKVAGEYQRAVVHYGHGYLTNNVGCTGG